MILYYIVDYETAIVLISINILSPWSLLQRIAGFHAWDFKVLKLMTTSLSNALTT